MLSVAPTFFHLLHVAVAPNPVIHLLSVGLLAAPQHCQRAAGLLHHVHDTVQQFSYMVKVLPLLSPLSVCQPVVNHFFLPGPCMHTNGSGSLADLPMIGGGVSVGVPVVMGDGHVIQPVVLRRERARVRQAVGLVGEPIGWAEALGGAYGAGPLIGVNIWVQGTISLKAVLFGSVWRPSLAVLVDIQQEFGGVHWGGGAGVQEQLLMLGQVLCWVLLRQPCTVKEFPLKEWQVGLQKGYDKRSQREVGGFLELGVKFFDG